MTPEELKRIAYHEAGHAIMAVHEGFPPSSILVHPAGAKTLGSSALPGASVMEFVSSRLRVLLAGAVAQWLVLGSEDKLYIKEVCALPDARGDWEKAREMIILLIHDRTGGREGGKQMIDRDIAALRDETALEIRAILDGNRAVLDEIAELTLAAFDELREMGEPQAGVPGLFVYPDAIEDALARVVRID